MRLKTDAYDKDAFDKLFRILEKPIYFFANQYLYRSSKDRQKDLEDIVGSTFEIIFRKIEKFKNPKNGAAWIFKITENLCKQFNRKRRKEIITDKIEIVDKRNLIEEKSNEIVLGEILKELTKEEKLIIILHELYDFTYEEIAKIVKLSVTTVKRRMKDIRERYKVHNE